MSFSKMLFAPAISLMKRLNFKASFLLMGVLLLVAIFIVIYNLYSSLNRVVNSTEQELVGLSLIKPLTQTVQVMQQHRGLSASVLGGATVLSEQRQTLEAQTSQALSNLRKSLPPHVLADQAWQEIEINWNKIRQSGMSWSVSENFEAHTQLVRNLLALENYLYHHYEIALDPSPESFHLGGAITVYLPQALEHLGQLRAFGTGVLAKKKIDNAQKAQFNILIGKFLASMGLLQDSLAMAATYNLDGHNIFLEISKGLNDPSQKIINNINEDILSERFSLPPEEYFVNATLIIDHSYDQIYKFLIPALKQRLEERTTSAQYKLNLSIGLAISLFLVVIYLSIAVYLIFMNNIRILTVSANKVAKGELDVRVNLDTKDELKHVGDLFNEVAEGVRAKFLELLKLKQAVEQAPVTIVVTDPDAHIQYANPFFTATTGYELSEVLGKKPSTLKSGYTSDEEYKQLWQTISSKKVWSGMFHNKRKDGSLYWEQAVISPVIDDSGNIASYVAVKEDVTERRRQEAALEDSENRLRTLFESTSDAVMLLDGRKFIDCNPATLILFGCGSKEEFCNFSPADLSPPLQPCGETSEILAAQKIANAVRFKHGFFEWQHKRLDNQEIFPAEVLLTTIEAGGTVILQAVVRDISERKAAEQAMNDAKDIAERSAKLRSEFLANMSHEIRTPMNGIIGLSELALNLNTGSEVRDYLSKILSSSQSLLSILNDILDFSKIEAGRLSIESTQFSLDDVLDNLRNLFEERARAKHLDFEILTSENTPRKLIGDALRLQQILSNLVGNAIKFTEHGHIVTKVEAVRREASHVQIRFSVEDTGIGINSEDLDKLFKPFSQVDGSITRRFGGSGLGLAISQNLLQLMGGKFEIRSIPDRGSVFSFILDFSLATFDNVHETRHRSRHGTGDLTHDLHDQGRLLKGAQILVAEDNSINQIVVKEFLKLSGMQVTLANNGQEAISQLDAQEFAAILMDVHMPVMGGVEATKIIRSNPKYANLPIIALTAGVTQDEREASQKAGMDDFVAKPIEPETLIAVLTRWIKRS